MATSAIRANMSFRIWLFSSNGVGGVPAGFNRSRRDDANGR
jgi:hypothetical protein